MDPMMELEPYLEAGEKVLWCDSPGPGFRPNPLDFVLVLVLGWTGLSALAMVASIGPAPLVKLLLTGLIAILPVLLYVGLRWRLAVRRRNATTYAITDRRALTLRRTRKPKLSAVAPGQLARIALKSLKQERGSIEFDDFKPRTSAFTLIDLDLFSGLPKGSHRFENIANADEVYQLMLQLQAQSSSPAMLAPASDRAEPSDGACCRTDHLMELAPYLAPGEKPIWTGAPQPGIHLASADALQIVPVLIALSFGAFLTGQLTSKHHNHNFIFTGIPFIVFAGLMTFGRYFIEARRRKYMIFAVTNRRVLILHGGRKPEMNSLALGLFDRVTVTSRKNDCGNIQFGDPPPPVRQRQNKQGWFGNQACMSLFEDIEHVHDVYQTILQLQAGSKKAPEAAQP
jgi:hypothetical protein